MFALDYQPSKRLRAAVKLAAIYATCVTMLLLLLGTTGSLERVLDILPFYSIPAAICFAIAFLLLAVARRAGFTALWLIGAGLWNWTVIQEMDLFGVRAGFLAWSVFAAPLYAMCTLGFPRQSPKPARWRQWISIAAGPAWAALVAIALQQLRLLDDLSYGRGQYLGRFWPWLFFAWLVVPPAITILGILRVHSRAPSDSSRPPQPDPAL